MSKMTTPEILEMARETPPQCLQEYLSNFTPDSEIVPTATYIIQCKHCSGELFSVLERRVVWEAEATPTGVVLICRKCRARSNLFDMRRDGYDGEHGHHDFIHGPEIEDILKDENGREYVNVEVRASFTYNNDLADLQADATAFNKRPQDFFDWFTLDVKCAARWVATVWECECA